MSQELKVVACKGSKPSAMINLKRGDMHERLRSEADINRSQGEDLQNQGHTFSLPP